MFQSEWMKWTEKFLKSMGDVQYLCGDNEDYDSGRMEN